MTKHEALDCLPAAHVKANAGLATGEVFAGIIKAADEFFISFLYRNNFEIVSRTIDAGWIDSEEARSKVLAAQRAVTDILFGPTKV